MEGDFFTKTAKKFAQENSSLLDNTPAVSVLNPDEVCRISVVLLHNQQHLTELLAQYDVVFFPGGHGPVFDGNLASDFITKSYAAGEAQP